MNWLVIRTLTGRVHKGGEWVSKEAMGVLVLPEPSPLLFPLSADKMVGEAVGSVKGVPKAGEGILDDVVVDGPGLTSGR